ncbi:hypothetical protein CAI22_03810 [Acinetobacter johnsonii]|nr:hypothetical protein [Acinetobacter johnsonii]
MKKSWEIHGLKRHKAACSSFNKRLNGLLKTQMMELKTNAYFLYIHTPLTAIIRAFSPFLRVCRP